MAKYKIPPKNNNKKIIRLCNHHDHLKCLSDSYSYMRKQETLDRMTDLTFRCDSNKMNALDESYFTSLIIKLSRKECGKLFNKIKVVYNEINNLLNSYNSKGEIYFETAHITIKSILDNQKQTKADLEKYIPIIKDLVKEWINRLGEQTSLYAMGIFTNLHPAKGLSLGIRFYPTLPLVQIIRGEIGNALYVALNEKRIPKDFLRPEGRFHTMLTHSTGFRARDLTFPLHPDFINRFVKIIDKYDNVVFGNVSDISIGDIYIRNGKSDKLSLYDQKKSKIGEEICIADYH